MNASYQTVMIGTPLDLHDTWVAGVVLSIVFLLTHTAVIQAADEVAVRDVLPAKFPKTQLDSLAKSFAGRLGFYAKDLRSSAEYAWNGDQRFPPASVIKLPMMIQLYRQAAAGELQLDETHRLPDDISTHGTSVLKGRDAPIELSLRDYCRLMIIHSDNMATDLVIRTVGTKATNQFLDDQGCKNTRVSLELGRWHYMIVGMTKTPISRANDQLVISRMKAGRFDNDGLGYSDSLKNNVCGPRDTGLLLERLYLGGLANHSHTDEMLKLILASTHKQTIAKYVKPGVQVANKYGGSERIAADAGIVELPERPIVIAAFVLSNDINNRSGRETLARMSRLVIAAIDPTAVKPIADD